MPEGGGVSCVIRRVDVLRSALSEQGMSMPKPQRKGSSSPVRCASVIRPNGFQGSLSVVDSAAAAPLGLSAPVFYDEQLTLASNDTVVNFLASLERPCFGGRGANAQSRTGVTILMRICRNIGVKSRCRGTAHLEVLLDRNADPLVCCDSGRNCLHDLFWGSSSLLSVDSPEAGMMARALELMLRAYGLSTVLILLTARDNHSFTALDYLSDVNWRQTVESVAKWAAGTTAASSQPQNSGDANAPKDVVFV